MHISVKIVFQFSSWVKCSFVSVLFLFFNCVDVKKTAGFDINQILNSEEDTVHILLEQAKFMEEKDSLLRAVEIYRSLQDKYPTNEFIVEINHKIKELNRKLEIKLLTNETNLIELNKLYNHSIEPDVKATIIQKIKKLIVIEDSLCVLSEYLAHDSFLLQRELAELRLKEVKDRELQTYYERAVNSNDFRFIKEFIERHPKHYGSDQLIIKSIFLESDSLRELSKKVPLTIQKQVSESFNPMLRIENQGRYTVTVFLVGPSVSRLSISPYNKNDIEIESGSYTITVLVSSPNSLIQTGDYFLNGTYLLEIN